MVLQIISFFFENDVTIILSFQLSNAPPAPKTTNIKNLSITYRHFNILQLFGQFTTQKHKVYKKLIKLYYHISCRAPTKGREKMKIIVDAAGCDNPSAFAAGIAEAINQTDAFIIVYGDESTIESSLADKQFDRARLEIVCANEVITNDESPVKAVIRKKNASLTLAMKRLAEDTSCQALISAGSTGAVLCAASIMLQKTADRPSLATTLPNKKGGFTCIADCGANVDCRPEQLVRFAELAAYYMNSFTDHKPIVATLSVGTEDKKGNALSKATFELLKQTDLNFIGNIEAKTVLDGDVDVVVCDGFDGNILLKSIEGTAKFVAEKYTRLLVSNLPDGTDKSFITKSLQQLTNTFDFTSQGGAVLLGVNKLVIKAHGAANSATLASCVKQAITALTGSKI